MPRNQGRLKSFEAFGLQDEGAKTFNWCSTLQLDVTSVDAGLLGKAKMFTKLLGTTQMFQVTNVGGFCTKDIIDIAIDANGDLFARGFM